MASRHFHAERRTGLPRSLSQSPRWRAAFVFGYSRGKKGKRRNQTHRRRRVDRKRSGQALSPPSFTQEQCRGQGPRRQGSASPLRAWPLAEYWSGLIPTTIQSTPYANVQRSGPPREDSGYQGKGSLVKDQLILPNAVETPLTVLEMKFVGKRHHTVPQS
jgi:hypothetical protein